MEYIIRLAEENDVAGLCNIRRNCAEEIEKWIYKML